MTTQTLATFGVVGFVIGLTISVFSSHFWVHHKWTRLVPFAYAAIADVALRLSVGLSIDPLPGLVMGAVLYGITWLIWKFDKRV